MLIMRQNLWSEVISFIRLTNLVVKKKIDKSSGIQTQLLRQTLVYFPAISIGLIKEIAFSPQPFLAYVLRLS